MTDNPQTPPNNNHDFDRSTDEAAFQGHDLPELEADLHRALTEPRTIPSHLKAQLISEGQALVAARTSAPPSHITTHPQPPKKPRVALWPIAAGLLIAAGAVVISTRVVTQTQSDLTAQQSLVEQLEERRNENERLLAQANARLQTTESELLQASHRVTTLTTQLVEITNQLNEAELTIARYEAPIDPELLQQNRQKLLDVPGTVRLAWSPFNLPEAPAPEQPNVTGDVVWNDELQSGYLRFVGLDPNDPNIEQYQVWIIDERGLEQKVSGGVFNANAEGEIIVPIQPGIDVGRVALFAVTVENPGGTWVPDLQRRIVVAPRNDT